jgi:hypothetical protein
LRLTALMGTDGLLATFDRKSSRNQSQSVAISRNQSQSVAISRNQSQSVPPSIGRVMPRPKHSSAASAFTFTLKARVQC